MAHARWIAPSLLALTAALPAADLATVLKVGATDDGLPTGPGATISYQWQVVDKPIGSGSVSFINRTLTGADITAGYTNSATASMVNALAGTYIFRVVATDRGGLSATSSNVVVTVYSQNPTISNITDRNGSVGVSSGAIAFTVSDRDPSAADSAAALVASATSSNTTVVPNSFTFGGSGANRTISFTPAAAGTATVQVKVTDAQGRAAYDTFVVTVTAPAPEIAVDLNGTDIPDGSTPTAIAGTVPNVATVVTYRIQNTGNATLTLGSYALGGLTNCSATFAATPPTSIAAGATAALAVRITPASAGAWSAGLSFATNDSNENPFNFTIGGTAQALPVSVRYRLDEANGATVTDAIGSLHASATGGYTRGAGQGGNAITLNGSTGYVVIPDGAAFNVASGSPFTLAAWVKTTDTEGAIVSLRSASNNTPLIDLLIGYDGADSQPGKVRVSVRDDGNVQGKITSAGTINDGQWHHVAVTRAANGSLTLYVDGQPTGTATGTPSGSITTAGRRAIGVEARWAFDTNLGTAGQRWLAGSVDDVWFSNTAAMSQSQLQSVIASANDGVPAPEIAVDRSGAHVADGGSSPITGTVPGVLTTIHYRVQNTGNAALTLGSFATSGASNCSANILTQPGSSIAAGASATLSVRVTPTSGGAWSFTVSGTTNDGDENPFNFTVSGNANAKPVVSAGRGQSIRIGIPAMLSGSVIDVDSSPTMTWSKYKGPGNVTFQNPNSATTSATFDQNGVYLLRLLANDTDSQVLAQTVVFVTLPGEFISDKRVPGFRKSNGWVASNAGYDGWSSLRSISAGATAAWARTLGSGWYDVRVYGVVSASAASLQTYQVSHATGTTSVPLTISGSNGWRSLGFYKSNGGTLTVTLTSVDGGSIADSVQWIGVPGPIIDNHNAEYSESNGWNSLANRGLNNNGARFSSVTGVSATWAFSPVSGTHRPLFFRLPGAGLSEDAKIRIVNGSFSKNYFIDYSSGNSGWADLGQVSLNSTHPTTLSLLNPGSQEIRADSIWLAKPISLTEAVDNAFTTGTWATRAIPDSGNGFVKSATAGQGVSFSWRQALPRATYRHWIYNAPSIDAVTSATVSIKRGSLTSNVIIDQRNSPKGWINLGDHFVGSGMSEIIITSTSTGVINSDAVRFEPIGDATPIIIGGAN